MGQIFSELGILNNQRTDTITSVTSITADSQSNIVSGGGAGIFSDIVYLKLTNHASFPIRLDLRDSISGSIRDRYFLSASGMFSQNYVVPLKQTTANTTWTLSASTADSVNFISVLVQTIKTLG